MAARRLLHEYHAAPTRLHYGDAGGANHLHELGWKLRLPLPASADPTNQPINTMYFACNATDQGRICL